MRDNKKILWLSLVFVVFSLFFINKAFHIDDPFTITIAKAIGEHFIRVPQNYQGNPIFMGEVYDNPILLGYYYAPIIRLFGEQEIWLHIFSLPFSLIAILSMYILSIRFTNRGFLTASCFLITPAFVVMSGNIMLDIPLLGLFLSALAAFIYGVDKDNKKLLFLSAILAGITSLVKYSGLLVILLMFIYALASSKKRYSLFLLIPIFIFFLWCIHNLIFYNRIYFLVGLLRKAKEFSINAIFIRIFACLSFLSGTSIITIFLIPYLLRKKINQLLLAFSLPIGVCPFLIKAPFIRYGNVEKSILAFLFISSFFLILLIFKACVLSIFKKPRDNDNLFLSLWFISLLIFTIGIQFIAARFILLLFPPMFLLIVKELNLNKIPPSLGLHNKFIFIPIVITIIISIVLAIGDYHLAGIYRDFVASFRKKVPSDKDIYFCPASFDTNLCYGYAYYLHKYYPQAENTKIEKNLNKVNNFLYFAPNGPFLSPCFYESCTDYFQGLDYNKNLIKSFYYKSNVVLHNRKFHAGFYSHDWGLLPFYISFKKVPLETFEVYQIVADHSAKIASP